MTATNKHSTAIELNGPFDQAVATAYNEAGDGYINYADGDPRQPFAFDGHYAYGDRYIWQILDAKLVALRSAGATTLLVVDMGCGPGTWLRRVVVRAHSLGFEAISARGFDIACHQIRRARDLSEHLVSRLGIRLSFDIGDALEPLPESDNSIDLCLCLCGVLNHIPVTDIPRVLGEIARVTAGEFITTVRSIGSTPTVYVDTIEHAHRFLQDNQLNRLDVEFRSGRHFSINSHLFSAAELRSLASAQFLIEDLRGLDLFHGRFASDPRWNPSGLNSNQKFSSELEHLEHIYCRDCEFIDHATHLLLRGKPWHIQQGQPISRFLPAA